MSEPNYNEQLITQYLLGTLPEAETERLDELSITDDQFAAALSAAEKELVDSYVNRELSDEELGRFKSHYLSSPLRRQKVDFAEALQIFGERSGGTSMAKASEQRRASSAGWLSSLFSNQRPALQWSFGLLALLLLVAAGLLLFQNNRLRQQIHQTQAQRDELRQRELELQKQVEEQQTANARNEQELARIRAEETRAEEQRRSDKVPSSPAATVVALFLRPQLRSGSQIETVTILPETERVATELQLEPNEYSTYSVALIDQSGGQVLWRSGKLKTNRAAVRKSLSVSLRAALLRVGSYRMQVSGIPPSGAPEVIGDYPFRVSR